MKILLLLPAALFPLPASANCTLNVIPVLQADCNFGDQNFRFQPACQSLYQSVTMADNVEKGSREARRQVEADIAKALRDNPTTGAKRGAALAGMQTANLHLGAIQLLLANLASVQADAEQALEVLKDANATDQSIYEQLRQDRNAQNQRQIDEYKAKLANQAKAKKKLEDGQRQASRREEKLKTLRGELAKLKAGHSEKMAALPDPKDKTLAEEEDAVTERLTSDEQSTFARLYSNCFQNNGLRAGCNRAIEAIGFISSMTSIGRFWAMVRSAGWLAAKTALKNYFGNDALRNLILCGEGKPFPVTTLEREGDSK